MMVYANEAIYDDPCSYCDTRYEIAGQWCGMHLPKMTYDTAARIFADNSSRCSGENQVD